MLQQDEPDDYVLATGESHSVREFVEGAFAHIGRPIEWRGEGVDEVGMDAKSNQPLVSIDPRYFRPDRGRATARRPREGEAQARLEPQRQLRGAGRRDDGVRPATHAGREAALWPRVKCRSASKAAASGSPAIAAWSARR